MGMLKRPAEYAAPSSLLVTKRAWSRDESRVWTLTFFIGTCVLYASRVALPICAAAIAQEYTWNKHDSGTVLSCFFWGYALTQCFAGGFADRHGGESILPYSTLAWTFLTFFTPQLFDLAYLTPAPLLVMVAVRVLTGIGQGFHLPSMASIVSQHLSATEKGRVFGICLAGSHFGTVVAGGVGSIMLEVFGWRALFQFVGAISLLWYWWFTYLTSSSGYRLSDEHEDAKKAELMEKAIDSKSSGIATIASAVPWRQLFSHPSFWAAAVAQYTGANAYFTMFNWLPSYFHENFPGEKGVVYNVVPSAAIVLTSMAAPFMASRLLDQGRSITTTRKIMECLSLIGCSMCLLVVPSTHSFAQALLIFTAAMACRGLHHGGVSVNPHDLAPQHTGAVFGIFNAFGAITGFVGVYVAGLILEATNNNWSYVFVVTAGQCVIGAIVFGLLGTGNRII